MVGRLRSWLTGEGAETPDLAARLAAAEAANEAKTRFLASVAHEIRSPLNAIYGYAQLLERGEGRDPVAAARTIRRSAEHLAHLAEGLLDMAQVEGGAMTLERAPIRLPEFLDGLIAMLRGQAEAKGLALVLERPAGLPEWVQGDARRLRQVLINLIANAIKFTDHGSVTLAVEYRNELATFTVSDTGIGIAPEDAERIFAPFERAGGAAAARPGAGLGLAITQALVHIMGGEIRVESAPGAGSRFTVRLMLSRPLAPPAAPPAGPGAITGYLGRERWVLVVDDDPAHAAILRALLVPLGFRLRSAVDGEGALAIAAELQPDLVLCDVALGSEDGWTLAERLARRHGPGMRIVMVSGEGAPPGRSEAPFVTKPFDFDALLAVIAESLALEWVRAPGADRPAPPPAAAARAPLPPHLAGTAAAHGAEIGRLVRIGHVRGIEAEIAALAALGPETAALAAALHTALDGFDMKGLAELARGIADHAG